MKDVGLMKIVTDIGPCYEKIVKEFIVNLSCECVVPQNLPFIFASHMIMT